MASEELTLCSVHTRLDLLDSCEELLKSIWPRCKAERLRQLAIDETRGPPCSLILIQHRENVPDAVIGHVRLTTVSNPESPKSAYVESLCVDKSKLGLGLGKKTLILAEKYAAEILGCEQAFLLCSQSMRGFYESLSYKEYPILALETVGVNLLRTFDLVYNWYGNKPLPGWETAYEGGPVASKDDMVGHVFGLSMMKKLRTGSG